MFKLNGKTDNYFEVLNRYVRALLPDLGHCAHTARILGDVKEEHQSVASRAIQNLLWRNRYIAFFHLRSSSIFYRRNRRYVPAKKSSRDIFYDISSAFCVHWLWWF